VESHDEMDGAGIGKGICRGVQFHGSTFKSNSSNDKEGIGVGRREERGKKTRLKASAIIVVLYEGDREND